MAQVQIEMNIAREIEVISLSLRARKKTDKHQPMPVDCCPVFMEIQSFVNL